MILKQRFLTDLLIGALKLEINKYSDEKQTDSQMKQNCTPIPITWHALGDTFFDFYYHIKSIEIKITIWEGYLIPNFVPSSINIEVSGLLFVYFYT